MGDVFKTLWLTMSLMWASARYLVGGFMTFTSMLWLAFAAIAVFFSLKAVYHSFIKNLPHIKKQCDKDNNYCRDSPSPSS